HHWSALIAAEKADVAACAAGADFQRGDLACLIYTSGTGGAPRGVMQHHGAILHNVEGTFDIIVDDFEIGHATAGGEIFLSFLPLSHAYEHSGGQFLPIGLGAQIYYAEGIEKLASNIEEVRPTVMISVPRLFELLRQRILNGLAKQDRLAQWLTRQALALGARAHAGKPRPGDRLIDLLLERTLRPKVRARFGGRIKAMVSGGAPLNPEVGIFFDALGIVLLQGYGQTEAGPVISCNRPGAGIRMDTVGPPIANTELRIADDGEILVRGELVMKGYWRNPELTSATVRDGWLATGDIGHLDDARRLVITDRKKDLIVLDKGDNVAPQRVEAMLTLQPEIAQAMVVGDKKPHLVGLIVPDAEWTSAWRKANGEASEALRGDPDYLRALTAAVDRVNHGLSVTEKVRRFILADEPFAIENQQLTPSMKIRRHVLKQVYGERLEALYAR
ncbi:MAG: long-chain fatty acid--CoA ligase, partial [Alphaproteobacteria bacterium]|nr:long-chain fatty acid--CoA ligase [Alphaproteobacteria bacterium]